MAGHAIPKGRTEVPRVPKRVIRRRRANQQTFEHLIRLAAENGVTRAAGASAPQVLQELLERAVARWRWAASEVDKVRPEDFWQYKLDAQSNRLAEPCKEYRLEVAAAKEVEHIAGLIAGLGISERLVKVEETREDEMIVIAESLRTMREREPAAELPAG